MATTSQKTEDSKNQLNQKSLEVDSRRANGLPSEPRYSTAKCEKIAALVEPAFFRALNENSLKIDEWNSPRQRCECVNWISRINARLKRDYSTRSFRIAACALAHASQIDKDLIMMNIMNRANNWQAWGLYYEVKYGEMQTISDYFPEPEFNINGRLPSGNTIIHEIVRGLGSPGLPEFLIDSGASVISENTDGHTALHLAVTEAISEKAERLISNLISSGANVNARDHKGQTPLHYAISRPHPPIASRVLYKLVECGANVLISDNEGHTALDLAKNNGSTEIAGILERIALNISIPETRQHSERTRL